VSIPGKHSAPDKGLEANIWVEKQELFTEHPRDFIVAEHLPLEHRRSQAATERLIRRVGGLVHHTFFRRDSGNNNTSRLIVTANLAAYGRSA
jgi:hypothetical protein